MTEQPEQISFIDADFQMFKQTNPNAYLELDYIRIMRVNKEQAETIKHLQQSKD